MNGGDWADPNARTIAVYLDGSDDPDRAEDGTWLLDDDFMVLVNSWWEPLGFTIPAPQPPRRRSGNRRPPLGHRAPLPAGSRRQPRVTDPRRPRPAR